MISALLKIIQNSIALARKNSSAQAECLVQLLSSRAIQVGHGLFEVIHQQDFSSK